MDVQVWCSWVVLVAILQAVTGRYPTNCPNPCTRHDCDFGQVRDGNGCPTCSCLAHRCPLRYCHPCKTGFQIENGCQICSCKPLCKQLTCTVHCRYGYTRDHNNCLTCQCERLHIARHAHAIRDPDMLDTVMDMMESRASARAKGRLYSQYVRGLQGAGAFYPNYQVQGQGRGQFQGQGYGANQVQAWIS